MVSEAEAFWVVGPGKGEIRTVVLPAPGPQDVVVRTLATGVSRGSELLVWSGRVPEEAHARMRAPFQDGEFPGPVKYGYLNVGLVEEGPENLVGRTVFTLFPHQTRFVVPGAAVHPLPEGIPIERAVLAGTVETALNALWEASPLMGDRVAVVGAGMVGCAVARLLARFPAVEVVLVDVEPGRADTAARLGVDFSAPEDAPVGCDLVFHASATSAGLQRALDLLVPDGLVVDLSWYGDDVVQLCLGSAFHVRRLGIRASQVGTVSASRRDRRSRRDRLSLSLDLLQDEAFDALLTATSPFDELPDLMADLAASNERSLCHVISYAKDVG